MPTRLLRSFARRRNAGSRSHRQSHLAMMYSFLLFLFVLDCALLMLVILIQDTKGQGLGGAFGGGGALTTSMFGGRGAADFLSKATTYMGTAFLLLCVIMSLVRPPIATDRSIIMESVEQQQIPETGLPLLPGATPMLPPPGGGAQPTPGTPDTSGGSGGGAR